MNDILLLKLLQSNDKQAFKYLFDTYFESMCRYMFLFLKDKQDVEEIALDIFMYVWENSEKLDIKVSFKAYLFQAARNRCLNAIRDKKETMSLENENEYAHLQTHIVSTLEIDELNNLIQEAILSLPDKCREVFVKSRQEHLSNQEIADEMQISIKTVEGQITKALKRIKETLGEQYYYLF